jgi:hypothetical protein
MLMLRTVGLSAFTSLFSTWSAPTSLTPVSLSLSGLKAHPMPPTHATAHPVVLNLPSQMTSGLANQSGMPTSMLLALPLIFVLIDKSPSCPHATARVSLLLGYKEGTHNYRIWDGNKVIITRDVIFPINSGDDFVNSGDGTFSAPIKLSLRGRVPGHTDDISTKLQPDSINTAARKISGDGNFYIQAKDRTYNFDDFLGDFHGMLQRNRNPELLGAGGGNNELLRLRVLIHPFKMRPHQFRMRPHLFPATQNRTPKTTRTTLLPSQTPKTHSTIWRTHSQLPHRPLIARPKHRVNGNTGNRQWMRNSQKWTNTKSGKLWTANPTCK